MNFLDGLINEARKKKKQVERTLFGAPQARSSVQQPQPVNRNPLQVAPQPRRQVSVAPVQQAPRVTIAPAPKPIQLPKVAPIKAQGLQVGNRTITPGPNVRTNVRPQVAPSLGERVARSNLGTTSLGVTRSLIGTGQAASGLYDLATPGKGTNRFSKQADIAAKNVDRYAKNSNKALYRGTQAVTDLAQFAGGGAGIKGVSKVAPALNRIPQAANTLRKPMLNAANKLNNGTVKGRIASNTIKGATDPRILAANAAQQAFYTGQQASKGNDINPYMEAGTFAAGQVAFPLAGAAAREAVAPAAKAAVSKLRQSNVIAPSRLNPDQVADLNRFNQSRGSYNMDDATYQRGLQAAQRAGVDANDAKAVDELINRHMNYQTQVQKAGNPITNAGQQLDRLINPRGLQVGGSTRKVNATTSPEIQTPKTVKVFIKSKFRDGGGYADLPVIRQVDNKTLYQGGSADGRQFWTENKKYAEQFGPVTEKTGSFYQVDNGNRMTTIYVEANPPQPTQVATDLNAVKPNIKVAARGGEKQVPVNQLTQQGDRIISNNVNPKIKRGEKRFAFDANGEMVPDTKGAYKLFTDDEGKVTQFRVGDKVYDMKDLGDLSTVNGYGKATLTMRRNIERAFGKDTAAKVNEFLVDYQQAQATKLIDRQVQLRDGLKEIANDLGISFGVGRRNAKKISAAIQDYGEKKIDASQLAQEFGDVTAGKIIRADQWFRQQYDSLLDEMNATLKQYGYPEVPKRDNYYTHFQEPSLWEKFGLGMQEVRNLASPTLQDTNPSGPRGSISNKLAGESEYMQPNKAFNKYALQRKGDQRTADAFGAFERYINPTLNNIYMTPAITRARVLAKAVAQNADVDGTDANKTLIQIKEWANNLAGKSNRFGDRQLSDTMFGPKALKALQFAQRQAGANSIVGNLATAALQPVVLSQTVGKFGLKNFLLGAAQEMSSAHAKTAPIRQSEFMRRRYSDLTPVTAGKTARAADAANTPLRVVEQTAARVTWNAAHNDALSQGLKGKKAIQYADIETEKTISGRSIGERPEIFNSKSAGLITMYQLEINNYWQQVSKEMTKSQVAKTLAAAYVFNLALQSATGRSVGFNPIEAAIDSFGEIGKEDKSAGDKIKSVGQRFAGEIVDNMPFVAPGLNMAFGEKGTKWLGPTSNAGRFGVSSPVGALTTTTDVGLPVNLPLNAILPFGGAQVKKTVDAARGLSAGETVDKNGDTKASFPVNPQNVARGLAFGTNAIPEVNTYNKNLGRKKVDQIPVTGSADLSSSKPRMTAAEAVKAGMTTKEAKEFLRLSPADQKALAATDSNARELYDQKQSIEKAFSGPKLRSAGLSEASTRILNRYDRLTPSGKKNFESKFTDMYALKKAQMENKQLSGAVDDDEAYKLQRSFYEYELANKAGAKTTKDFKAYKESPFGKFEIADQQFQLDVANNKISSVDAYKKQDELFKLQVQSPFSKEAVEIMGMSEKRILDYLASSSTPQALKDELVALDQASTAAGLYKYSKLDGASGRGGSGGRGSKLSPADFKLPGTDIAVATKGAQLARSASLKGGRKITARAVNAGKPKLESNRLKRKKTLA